MCGPSGKETSNVDSQSVGPSSVGRYVGPSVWRGSKSVTLLNPLWPGRTMDPWGPYQCAGPSVRRDSDSVCGARRDLDGQSICGTVTSYIF